MLHVSSKSTRSVLFIAMGSYVRIRLQAARDADSDAAVAAVRTAIRSCEARFSLYRSLEQPIYKVNPASPLDHSLSRTTRTATFFSFS